MTVREGLPRVPYATALDIFLNVCLVYNLSALIEYAGVNYFTKTGPGDPPENEETRWEAKFLFNISYIPTDILIQIGQVGPYGVAASVLDCSILLSEFELQSRY